MSPQEQVAEVVDAATPRQLPMNPEIKVPALPSPQEIGQLPVEASVSPVETPEYQVGDAAVVAPAQEVGNEAIPKGDAVPIDVNVTFH